MSVNHDRYDDAFLRRILRETKTIAMVGASANWNRPSYFAMKYLLDRGYRMVELLKQPQFKPMDVIDQVMAIYAGTKGFLDDVPRPQVLQWQDKFLIYMRDQASAVPSWQAKLAIVYEPTLPPANTSASVTLSPA